MELLYAVFSNYPAIGSINVPVCVSRPVWLAIVMYWIVIPFCSLSINLTLIV